MTTLNPRVKARKKPDQWNSFLELLQTNIGTKFSRSYLIEQIGGRSDRENTIDHYRKLLTEAGYLTKGFREKKETLYTLIRPVPLYLSIKRLREQL